MLGNRIFSHVTAVFVPEKDAMRGNQGGSRVPGCLDTVM